MVMIQIGARIKQYCLDHRSSIYLIPLLFFLGMNFLISIGWLFVYLGQSQIIISLIAVWIVVLITDNHSCYPIGNCRSDPCGNSS